MFMLAGAVARTASNHEHVLLFFGMHAGEAATKGEHAEEEGFVHRYV
jgi:hypothetical protein